MRIKSWARNLNRPSLAPAHPMLFQIKCRCRQQALNGLSSASDRVQIPISWPSSTLLEVRLTKAFSTRSERSMKCRELDLDSLADSLRGYQMEGFSFRYACQSSETTLLFPEFAPMNWPGGYISYLKYCSMAVLSSAIPWFKTIIIKS